MTLALATALRYFALPASALPYNLVVLVLVYALRQRHATGGLHPSPAPGMLPETAGRFVVLNSSRFPHLQLPALDLPFKDECVITQGINGSMTHRAPWNWALDFEVLAHDQRNVKSGAALEDYHTFNKLVLAPCTGTVAAVKRMVPDNLPGANNPEENWGNYVVICSDAGLPRPARPSAPGRAVGSRRAADRFRRAGRPLRKFGTFARAASAFANPGSGPAGRPDAPVLPEKRERDQPGRAGISDLGDSRRVRG